MSGIRHTGQLIGKANTKVEQGSTATLPDCAAPGEMHSAIAYALEHKKSRSTGRCLAYVKKALLHAGYFTSYPGGMHAKDFGPALAGRGFINLLDSSAGMNLETAPIGSVIIYDPVETQTNPDGTTISGHIEIKYAGGYVSDFATPLPTFHTNPLTLVSPRDRKYKVTFKVIGIWYKE